MKEIKEKRGITLIALAITIVVLLILAAITISVVLSDNGIIGKAQEAANVMNNSLDDDYNKLENLLDDMFGEEDNDYVHIEEDPDGEKVPIPFGFTPSKATGEDRVSEGWVIYEGLDEITDANVEEARKTRDQFVWIPVDNYEREDYEGSSNSYTEEIDEKSKEEIKKIEESILTYGGFFIGRYEVGNEGGKAVSKQGYEPETNITMENAMNNARSMYTEDNQNYGATSTMVYGRQWDSAMKYIEKTTDVKNSTNYGNYSDFNRNTAGISIAQNYNNINKYLADINRVSYNYPIEKAAMKNVDIESTLDFSTSSDITKTVQSYENVLNLNLNIKLNEESYKSWIRVRVGRKDNNNTINDITVEGNNIIKKGNYYYYTNLLEPGGELNLNVKIKNNVNCSLEELKSEILILSHGLEGEGYAKPDFSKDNPFEGLVDESYYDNFFREYAKENGLKVRQVSNSKEYFELAYFEDSDSHEIDYTCLPNTKEETGYSDKWRINSIYDIAGNVSEYTMEKSNNSNVVRGGKFYQKGADDYMAKRQLVGEGNISDDIGYRAALYIKY